MPTSQPLSQVTATHRPAGELVAYAHRPSGPRSLLEEWRRYKARQPAPQPAPGPVVVQLPKHLLN
jgi:hypothetical protein